MAEFNLSGDSSCLTKADLVDSIYDNLPVDKQKASDIVEDLIELIKSSLLTDDKVMISGFGSFEVKAKNARPGRNPQTGDRITLDARKVVKFKPSQIFRKELNDAINAEQNQGEGSDSQGEAGSSVSS